MEMENEEQEMENEEQEMENEEQEMENEEQGMGNEKIKLEITFKKTIFLWRFFVYYTTSIFS